MADTIGVVTLLDGTIVDGDTGEVIREGEGWANVGPEPSDRARYLASMVADAKAQADAWETQRKVLGRLLYDASGEAKHIETAYHKITIVPSSHVETASVDDVAKAVKMELITDTEAEHLILSAARGNLDRATVKAWIAEQDEARRKPLTAALIGGYDRAGYPKIAPILHAAPQQEPAP